MLLIGVLVRIVKSCTQTAKCLVMKAGIENAIADLKVILPPKVLVVQPVILIQQDEVLGQMIHRREIQSVDVRMWRSKFSVSAVSVHHDRDDRVT